MRMEDVGLRYATRGPKGAATSLAAGCGEAGESAMSFDGQVGFGSDSVHFGPEL
jgi:hypothetical protein